MQIVFLGLGLSSVVAVLRGDTCGVESLRGESPSSPVQVACKSWHWRGRGHEYRDASSLSVQSGSAPCSLFGVVLERPVKVLASQVS